MKKLFFWVFFLVMFIFQFNSTNLTNANNNLEHLISQKLKSSICSGESRLINVIVKQDIIIDLLPCSDFGTKTYKVGIKLDCFEVFKIIFFEKGTTLAKYLSNKPYAVKVRYFDENGCLQLIVIMEKIKAINFNWGQYGSYLKILDKCIICGTEKGKKGL